MASVTAQSNDPLHVSFFPFMSPSHLSPMIDIARLFASHGAKATILATPQNITCFQIILNRDQHTTTNNNNINIIDLLILDFPYSEANLPENCENLDTLPSQKLSYNFTKAIMMLQPQAQQLLQQHQLDAIISDLNFPWTAEIAQNCGIPRLVFHGTCCFSLCLTSSSATCASQYKPHATVSSDTKPFLVLGLPHPVYITMSQMPDRFFGNLGLHEFFEKFMEAERDMYGFVSNMFYEIEPEYVKQYEKLGCTDKAKHEKLVGKKVWPVGPVLLFNTIALDKVERGNRASIDKDQLLTWLDSKKPNSVLYVCFGGLCNFSKSQLLEIGDSYRDGFFPKGFEERVRDRTLVIKGWAPQVLILNHSAVGGFMTHCGWNSVLESVTAGVPLITWPLFAEQFYNENFVLNRLGAGAGIGVKTGLAWGEEENIGVLVTGDRVEEVVTRLMAERTRNRVSELNKLAMVAISKGGSSYVNMGLLIEDLQNLRSDRLSKSE
ncbi:hypothetical protein ACB092_09G032700 [Castanea dentata]